MSDTVELVNFAMSPPSSFCSDSSSCGKSSPHSSSIGLRRSTIDLSRLEYAGRFSETCLTSRISSSGSSHTLIAEDASDIPKEQSMQIRRMHRDGVKRNYHRGIEAIMEDTFLDPLRVFDVANLCAAVLSLVLSAGQSENNDYEKESRDTFVGSRSTDKVQRQSQHDDDPNADLFSPCKVKIRIEETHDDWDYFADFQDQIDDNLSSSPFSTRKSTKVLDTLNESEEEDDSEGDHFF